MKVVSAAGLTAIAVLSGALAGCGNFVNAPQATDVDPRVRSDAKAPSLALDVSAAGTVEFAALRFNLRFGQPIGKQRGNMVGCQGVGDRTMTWQGGVIDLRRGRFAAAFNDAFLAAGYKVPRAGSSVFGSGPAAYAIGASVSALNIELCHRADSRDLGYRGIIGAGSMDIAWEVYSRLEGRVVYRTTMVAGGRLNRALEKGNVELLAIIFGNAAARLAADPEFVRAISSGGTSAVAARRDEGAPIALAPSGALGGTIVGNMQRIRRATVVVSFAGHGSGFLIDPRGYVLTNAHVVGDADRVRVKLFEGPGVVGRVVRRDAVRDVALVKVPPPGRAALPLRRLRARVGEPVYAVGAPGSQDLEATVSRGIVGGIRRGPGGLVYIQADATVHPGSSGGPLVDAAGNVVGLTVAALKDRRGGLAAGLNLFIPIGDALRRLNLRH